MKLLINIAVFLMPLASFSQTKIYNTILKNKNEKFVYRGVMNNLKIDCNNSKHCACTLKINGIEQKFNKDGEVEYAQGAEKSIIITVFKNNKLTTTEVFTVKRMPDPSTEENPTILKVNFKKS